MENEKRIESLKKLIEKGILITTGGMIGAPKVSSTPHGLSDVTPVVIFVEKPITDQKPPFDDMVIPSETWLATPIGVPLFEAGEFHEWCKDHAKETFLKNFDRMLQSRISGLK